MLDRLSALWSQMGAVGVKDVVYVQYSDSDRIDYDFGLPDGDGVARRCGAVPTPLRCHVLATSEIVRGDLPDELHPSERAYERLGRALHGFMRTRQIPR